jgi:hypothetical protein
VSRAEGGHRPGDQEDGEQPDPDPGLGPVGGPAQWVAVQPERTSQPREATRRARPGFHGLTVAQPLMQEVASTQSSTSEVLADLNMTNNPFWLYQYNCTRNCGSWPAADGYRAISVSVG